MNSLKKKKGRGNFGPIIKEIDKFTPPKKKFQFCTSDVNLINAILFYE